MGRSAYGMVRRWLTVLCIMLGVFFPLFVQGNTNFIDKINFEEIFEEHGTNMLIIDIHSGQIMYSNEAAAKFYGYSRAKLQQMTIQEINALSPEETEQERRAAAAEDRNFFRFKHVLSNGEVRDVEVYSYPVSIGENTFLYSIIHDISARVELENTIKKRNISVIVILAVASVMLFVAAALIGRSNHKNKIMKIKVENSERILREIFNNIKTGIFLYDIDNERQTRSVLLANKYALELLDYTKEELYEKDITSLTVNSERDKFSYYLEQVIKNNKANKNSVISFETQFQTKGSQILDIGLKSNVFILNGNRTILTVFQDITIGKKREQELKMLHRAIEQSPNAVVITDATGVIQYVNEKFTDITGFSEQEAIGETQILYKDNTEEAKQVYKETWDAIYAGESWIGEFKNKKKDGTIYWARAIIAPVLNEQGQLTNIVSMHEDVSERKEMESKLIEKNTKIRAALLERKQLQQQLIQQEKMAAIGQLAAGVAHEINNPLSYVMSNFETIKKYIGMYNEAIVHKSDKKSIDSTRIESRLQMVQEDFTDLLSDVREGLNRIKKIVESLRNFSRMDTNDRFEPYDINDGILTTLEIANNELKYIAEAKKNLEKVPEIEAMPYQLNQVILNLIINAVQAIKEKKMERLGTITISTWVNETYVYMSIEDNGIGISDENQKQVFNPFFTTKAVGEGTGLGLSISYDIIVNKHKGEIILDSTEGIGSIFTLKLPTKQI